MKYTLCLLLCIFLVISCRLQAQIIHTYAGNGMKGYTGNGGPATAATLDSPTSITGDVSGNIYFADQQNNCIRKVNASGIISTIAGNSIYGYGGNGGPATIAEMSDCWGLAIDGPGNVYITDQEFHCVRKVNTSGIISTIVNIDTTDGTGGDSGPAAAAHLKRPIGITTDGTGNIYVGDQDAFNIREINTSGIISTFAGVTASPGNNGDGGPATNARFHATYGLATDNAGNVYICDAENNRVRMVNTSGIITTVAGNGAPGFGGDGGAAIACKLNHPTGVFVDGAGNIFIADYYNNRIRKVNTSGIIKTIAGTGSLGFGGDGEVCTNAELAYPTGVYVDNAQNIYITDYFNNRIRKISKSVFFSGGHALNFALCENSLLVSLDSLLSIIDGAVGLNDTLSFSSHPGHGTANVTYSTPATGSAVTPSGLYYTPHPGYIGNDTFTVVVSNGIMTDTATVFITVEPLVQTAGIITGDSSVCAGSSINLADSISGGTWTISNLNAIVINGMVTGETPGTDTVTYTVANICGSANTSKVITINPLPYVGTITGPAELCIASSEIVTDTVTGGTWSISNTLATINPNLTSCLLSAIATGIDTVLYTVTDSVCSASAVLAVTIDSFPTATITGGKTGLCIDANIFLAGVPAGGIWGISNNSATFDATGGVLTGMLAGMDTVSYTVSNFCGTAVDFFSFSVDSLPVTPIITRNEGTVYAPAGYTSYQWTLNGGSIPAAAADTFLLDNVGYYAVTVTNSFGCSISSDSIYFQGCAPDDIIIFPNPSESMVYINWCEEVTARLMCVDGKQVKTVYNTNEIDLGNLPDAVYLLVLYDEHGNKIKAKCIVKLAK